MTARVTEGVKRTRFHYRSDSSGHFCMEQLQRFFALHLGEGYTTAPRIPQ